MLSLIQYPDCYAVCKLPERSLPDWAAHSPFLTYSLTPTESSLVCLQSAVPEGIEYERDFICFGIDGTLDFALTGIIAKLTAILAEAEIPVFVISTFDTDYLLVREPHAKQAATLWQMAGYKLRV